MAKKKSKPLKKAMTTDLVPEWSVGAWIYGGYVGSKSDTAAGTFNSTTWYNTIQPVINTYNQEAAAYGTTLLQMFYPYASDLELPWASASSIAADEKGDIANALNSVNNYSLSMTPSTIDPTTLAFITRNTSAHISPIIDGRINNGYLFDLNVLCPATQKNPPTPCFSSTDVTALANMLATQAIQMNQNKIVSYLDGLQLDFEPVDTSSTTGANQIAFYTQLGTQLAPANIYFSIFTFPSQMNQNMANMLGNNGYAIIALYDLATGAPSWSPSETFDVGAAELPVSLDSGTPTYSTALPNSISDYTASVNYAVQQTFYLASKYNIKFKFAIPAGASVHEFESWGKYNCTYDATSALTKGGIIQEATCTEGTLLSNKHNVTQLQYVQAAINAINNGIELAPTFNQYDSTWVYDPTLFRGVDLYGFSSKALWTPTPPVVDWYSGDIYYGSNGPDAVPLAQESAPFYKQSDLDKLNPPYIYTTPGYPTDDVLTWLAQNMVKQPTQS